jgi:rsbT co-antagonist protein RsbR
MAIELRQFGTFLREQVDTRIIKLMDSIAEAGPSYAQDTHSHEKVRMSYLALVECIEMNDKQQLVEISKSIGMERATSGFAIQEVLNSVEMMRNHIWELLIEYMNERGGWPYERVRMLEDFTHTFMINIAASFGMVLEQTRSEMQEQSEKLEAQSQTIRELGTPIMPVYEGVLVLPLVGILDSYRASQVMETLLEAISSYQADIVIIDITGVPLVDTSVANYILQAARAAKLVGAQVILVGIGSEIAQTMVHLGVDMHDIMTLANLQEGLQYAFEQLGISMVHRSKPHLRQQNQSPMYMM